ncbi:cytosine permease [Herbiconiux sp.]|uniref:purine-cytosine permease family protein n=1 Tax=Herbiconiux sp. TaxID=1871186 RepID=UPI0025C35339|nr:cytosine permease [Herbiconiux sp.]
MSVSEPTRSTSVSESPISSTDYGHKLAAVEPGGVEAIPLDQRHGRPRNLAWTWASPNLEFATIFVGAIAVLYYGLDLGTAIIAIVLGNTVASLFHYLLTTWGPATGLCQMVISRKAFGYLGNIVPGGLNAVLVGVGWFAVNSVSGGFALAALTGMPPLAAVLISSVISFALAFFGHNLIQVFERFAFPILALVFLAGIVFIAPQADFQAPAEPIPGAFWVAVSTSFGYTIAWAPFAADYSRYLKPADAKPAGLFAALGVWVSNNLLQVAGAAAVTAVGLSAWNYDNPTSSYTELMPTWLAAPTLLAIWLGALCANALNLYSSGLSFAAIGIRPPTFFSRAAIVVGVGILGVLLAVVALSDVSSYENFLLVMGYWIAPWLGVIVADRVLGRQVPPAEYTHRRFRNPAGPIAMVTAMVVSILLFSNQTLYVGPVPAALPELGDVTFIVGFVLAFGLYAVLRRVVASGIPNQTPTPATSKENLA